MSETPPQKHYHDALHPSKRTLVRQRKKRKQVAEEVNAFVPSSVLENETNSIEADLKSTFGSFSQDDYEIYEQPSHDDLNAEMSGNDKEIGSVPPAYDLLQCNIHVLSRSPSLAAEEGELDIDEDEVENFPDPDCLMNFTDVDIDDHDIPEVTESEDEASTLDLTDHRMHENSNSTEQSSNSRGHDSFEKVIHDKNFLSPVKDINTSLEFIRAIRNATLGNSGLSNEQLQRLKNPPKHFLELQNEAEKLSLEMFMSMLDAPDETYRKVQRTYNRRHIEEPMLSLEQVKSRISLWTGIEPLQTDMCPTSCIAYTGLYSELDNCPFCNTLRWDSFILEESDGKIKIPARKYYTFPIGPQLQALYRNPKKAASLGYRRKKTIEILQELTQNDGRITVYSDILCGWQYLQDVLNGKINDTSIVFMTGMDGAQLYRHKQSDCWFYIFVLLELAPEERYQKKHVLIGGIFPGPNKPKNPDSFLFPGLYHIAALQKEGLQIWDGCTKNTFRANLYYFLSCSDAPGSVYLSGLVGYYGTFGCRLFCGLKGRNKPGTPHYYPALLRPNDYPCDKENAPDQDPDAISFSSENLYMAQLTYLLGSTSESNYVHIRRPASGITRPSILLGLLPTHRPSLIGTFNGDLMHTATLNAGELLLDLWRGTFKRAATDKVEDWPWVVLRGEVWQDHGVAVAASRPYIPGSFDRAPRNIAEKINSGYKAKEWQAYLYGLAPILLYNILPLPYWRNYCKFVAAQRILHQRIIQAEETVRAQTLLNNFLVEFEKLYVQRRTDRIHMVRPWLHTLAHGGKEVTRVGPAGLGSTWTIERTIGNLGEEIRQPSNPYANLAERGLRRCQINALKALLPELDETSERLLPRGGRSIGSGFVLLRAHDRYPKIQKGIIAQRISESVYFQGQTGDVRIARWAKLRLPNGQVARSAWKEIPKVLKDIRMARFVKLKLNGKICFGEVQFFFLTPDEQQIPLALIWLYSDPETSLLELSHGVIHSVMKLPEEEGLTVVEVKVILSVVAMIPHEHISGARSGGQFCVWERIGLAVSSLGGAFENIQDNIVDESNDVVYSQ